MAGRSDRAVLMASLRVRLGLVAVLGVLGVTVLGVMYAGHGRPGALDAWIIAPTADSIESPWRRVALAVDFLGEPVGAAALVALAVTGCLLLRRSRAAVLVVVGPGLTVGVTTGLKYVVGRTIHGDNLSYPSGHTGFLTALALAVALCAAGWFGLGRAAGALLVLGAALVAGAAMGWAQVALTAHYPTDAMGGWCTALVVVPATAWVVDRVADAGAPERRHVRTGDGTRV
ncbi:phosphatase PAP2 family protein [Streptomyces sp. NPDC054863]